MKKLILITAISLFNLMAYAQTTVKTDKAGNYVAIAKDSVKPTNTGKTYTDSKGIVYPVYQSTKGKLFVIRTSKAGNVYNQYLKTN